MGVLRWITDLIDPITKTIDELHFSGEEQGELEFKKAELRNKLAEIEAKVVTKTLEYQALSLEANAKMAVAEQQHGNVFTKAVRPTIQLGNWIIKFAMAFGFIEFNLNILIVCGGWNAGYAYLRTKEKQSGVSNVK